MEKFENVLAAVGRRFDQCEHLGPARRADLLGEILDALEPILRSAEERDAEERDAVSREVEEKVEVAAERRAKELRVQRERVDRVRLRNIEGRIAEKLYEHGSTHDSIRSLFIDFDELNTGTLKPEEFRYALESLGIFLDDDEVLAVHQHFDTNNDGSIDYHELLAVVENVDWGRDKYGPVGKSSSGRPHRMLEPSPAMRQAALLDLIRSHVDKKHGSPHHAWMAYHRGRNGLLPVEVLHNRLRREGVPVTLQDLKSMVRGKSNMDLADFSALMSHATPGGRPGWLRDDDSPSLSHRLRAAPTPVPQPQRTVAAALPVERLSSEGERGRGELTRELLLKVNDALETSPMSLHDLYKAMRRHGSLGVDPEDLKWGFRKKLRVDLTPSEAQAIVWNMDEDKKGSLTFGDFLHVAEAAAGAAEDHRYGL